jgi:hypothetical protein
MQDAGTLECGINRPLKIVAFREVAKGSMSTFSAEALPFSDGAIGRIGLVSSGENTRKVALLIVFPP